MKTALINFELWHTTDVVSSEDKINHHRVSLVLQDIKTAIAKNNVDTIVGLLLIDGFLYSSEFYTALATIEKEAKKIGIKNFYLLPGMCGLGKYQSEIDKHNLSYKVLTGYDFSAKQMWLSYKNTPERQWNPDTNKFLFLGGVPSRPNRIGLLNRYYNNNMLHDCKWSFFPPWTEEDKAWCRKYLHMYNDDEYYKFLSFCTKSIDSKYSTAKKYSTSSGIDLISNNVLETEWVKDPSYIDPAVYADTSLSILSKYEYSKATSHSFLGEKTWRAVINKHPFILADNKSGERFDYMKSIGLDIFDKFTVGNYGYIDNEEERLDAVVESTKQFMSNINNHKQEINNSIENNYNVFCKICEQNKEIEMLLTDYLNASQESMEWLELQGYDKFIRIPE